MFIIVKELFEFIALTSLYLNVRPRIWPHFFSLELYEEQREFLQEFLLQEFQQYNLQDMRRFLPPQPDLCEVSLHESSFECTTGV